MSERQRKQWELLGASDPYWAVLTDPQKRNGKWNKEEFFQTGVDEINRIEGRLSGLGLQLMRGTALDYGCGVGRLSRALSPRFERVMGVDISDTMLQEARSANRSCSNLQFLRGNGRDLAGFADRTVDFIYSNIVLQHSPENIQRALIAELCRVLRRGGVLVFQTPSHADLTSIKGLLHRILGNRVLNVGRGMVRGKDHVMELHTVKKAEVLKILRREGLSVVETETDDAAGEGFVSYTYFAARS